MLGKILLFPFKTVGKIGGAFLKAVPKEVIEEINRTGQLPPNLKVRFDKAGNPYLTWNLFNITPGYNKIPGNWKLKQDVLGFTHVDYKGFKTVSDSNGIIKYIPEGVDELLNHKDSLMDRMSGNSGYMFA